MYQFTTTNIINSSLDSNGVTAKFAGSATQLKVARVNTFLKDNIVSIYKRAYRVGVKEIAQVTIPVITAGLVARLDVDVRLAQQTNSEYASTHLYFSKPVVIEVIATGTAATDATALAAQVNKLKDRFGFSYITATTSGADVILTATDTNQRIESIKILKEAGYTDNSLVEPKYTDVTASTFSVTTAGSAGFGDDDWMAQRVKIPTMENTRKFGISADERPVIGGNYTQYTLRYSITKDGTDGIVSGGTSVTTHVFYVLSSLVSSFEAAIIATGKIIDTIGTAVTAVTIGGDTLTMSAAAGTTTLTATTTPSGVTGAVWTLTGDNTVVGTLDATKLTLTTAGVMTVVAASGLAADDTIGVSVTVDGFTETGDVTIAGS